MPGSICRLRSGQGDKVGEKKNHSIFSWSFRHCYDWSSYWLNSSIRCMCRFTVVKKMVILKTEVENITLFSTKIQLGHVTNPPLLVYIYASCHGYSIQYIITTWVSTVSGPSSFKRRGWGSQKSLSTVKNNDIKSEILEGLNMNKLLVCIHCILLQQI